MLTFWKGMRCLYFMLIMSVLPFVGISQPGDPGDDPDPVPIGGIEILLLAGGALGVKKLWFGRKK